MEPRRAKLAELYKDDPNVVPVDGCEDIHEGFPPEVLGTYPALAETLGIDRLSLWRRLHWDGIMPAPVFSPDECEFLRMVWVCTRRKPE